MSANTPIKYTHASMTLMILNAALPERVSCIAPDAFRVVNIADIVRSKLTSRKYMSGKLKNIAYDNTHCVTVTHLLSLIRLAITVNTTYMMASMK